MEVEQTDNSKSGVLDKLENGTWFCLMGLASLGLGISQLLAQRLDTAQLSAGEDPSKLEEQSFPFTFGEIFRGKFQNGNSNEFV